MNLSRFFIMSLVLTTACQRGVPEPVAAGHTEGHIVITEIMQNPSAVDDSHGEYFEICNCTSDTIDIEGWVIRDDGTDFHVIDNGGAGVNVPPWRFAVLAIDGNSETNGNIPSVLYTYSGFTLDNDDDEIVLENSDGVEIDRVSYDGGPEFPDPTGASMTLIHGDAWANDDGSRWAEETEATYGDGDKGTPGTCVGVLFAIL